MSDLVARAVLNGDATGLVTAATQAEAGLNKVTAAADGASASSKALASSTDAAAIAESGLAKSADLAAAAIGNNTKTKLADIAALEAMASGNATAVAKIGALSAATSEYNSTVNAARTLLAQGVITQEAYTAAVDGASAKLAVARVWHDESSAAMVTEKEAAAAVALGLVGLGQSAEHAAVSTGKTATELEHLGRAGGIGREQLMAVKSAMGLIIDNPVVAALLLVTAGVVAATVAEVQYDNAVNHLNQDLKAHALVLAATGQSYSAYVDEIAKASDSSTRTSRQLATDAVSGGITPNAWATLAAAARGYASVTGTDLPTAYKTLVDATKGGAQGIADINGQYQIFDASSVKMIRDLDQQGNKFESQQAIADGLRDKFGQMGGAVTALGVLVENAGKNFDQFWDAAGKATPDWIGSVLDAVGYGGIVEEAAKKAHDNAVAGATATADDIAKAQKVAASNYAQGIIDQYDTFGAQLRDLGNQHFGVSQKLAAGLIDEGTAQTALTAINQQAAKVRKEQHDAELNLNKVEKDHEELVSRALAAGPQALAQANDETKASIAQIVAYDGTTQSLKNAQDQLAIQKATLPYVTALHYAQGAAAIALKGDIDKLTDSMKQQQQAEKDLAALQSAHSDFTGLTEFYQPSLKNGAQLLDPLQTQAQSQKVYLAQLDQITSDHADAISANQKRLMKAYLDPSVDLDKAVLVYQDASNEIEQVFYNKQAKAQQDYLARNTDWVSGVKRGLSDLEKATDNWAATSEKAVTDTSAEFETDFISALNGGKDAVSKFAEFVLEELEKIAYQKYLAQGVDSVIGDVVGGIGSVLGLDSAGVSSADLDASSAALSSQVSVPSINAGVHHTGIYGGSIDSPSSKRWVSAAYFDDAPRRHGGGTADHAGIDYAGGERPVIVKNDEIISTQQQWNDHAGPVLVAGSGASQSQPPVVNFNVKADPRIRVTQGAQTPNGSGGIDTEMLIDIVEHGVADRIHNGRSAIGSAAESSYGLTRGSS